VPLDFINFQSFKDPDARVVFLENQVIRLLHTTYCPIFEEVNASGLWEELLRKELVLDYQRIEPQIAVPDYPIEILPEQLEVQVLPFEWTESIWKDCLQTFLEINLTALSYGFILKDATPYNFCLYQGKMKLVDTSSFTRFHNGDPWLAYRQFCEELLGPFLLMHYGGHEWSRFMMASIRGLDLRFISKNLPLASWFNLQAFLHIHLHKYFSNTKQLQKTQKAPQKVFSMDTLMSTLKSLQLGVQKTQTKSKGHWQNYYQEFIHSETYLLEKKEIISQWLGSIPKGSVIDLGANVGEFSILASQMHSRVLAVEFDPTCVEILYDTLQKNKLKNLYPACADLTQLSPNLGNNLQEFANFFERGKSDILMALALVHHLAITYSFSFDQIFQSFKRLGASYVLVEFIPPSDDKVQVLLQNRGKQFDSYDQIHFEESMLRFAEILEVKEIGDSGRILYWGKF